MCKLDRKSGDGDPSLEGGSGESRWLPKRCSADKEEEQLALRIRWDGGHSPTCAHTPKLLMLTPIAEARRHRTRSQLMLR